MRFNPLIAAIAGLFVIIAIPALVKDRHHGAGEDRRTEAQQRNAALPAPLTQAPSSSGNAQGAPCPGTEQSKYDCDTVSAIANVRQADAAERFNRLAIFEIGVGFVTAIVAFFAALFAKNAVAAARENLAHDRESSATELRPWLQIKVSAGIYRVSEKQASLEYKLEVTNIGKTPAVQVFREAQLFNFGPEQESKIPEFFEGAYVCPGSRPRQILPNGKIEMDGTATMKRDELAVIDTNSDLFVFPVLAIRVLYEWGDSRSGRTCESFGVFRPRTDHDPAWHPIRLLRPDDSASWAALKSSGFHSIR